MTLADFKSNPKLMQAAADLRIHATYQQVVDVLDTEMRKIHLGIEITSSHP